MFLTKSEVRMLLILAGLLIFIIICCGPQGVGSLITHKSYH